MLGLLECAVSERGGAYVFCDTDSLAIVGSERGGLIACPGGAHRLPDGSHAVNALSWQEVEEVRQRFSTLNPYDRAAVPGSILKVEDENFDEDTGGQCELLCYAISAKRYVLFHLDGDGRPVICKYSRHGLGHLLNPTDPDSRDDDWIEEVWRYVLAADVYGQVPTQPAWFARPALGRVGVNDSRMLALFAALNKGKPYAEQVKPQNFLLSAQVAQLGHPPGVDPSKPFHLVAPYNPDPQQWLKLRFTDRYSGKGYRVTAGDAVAEGVARVKTYGDVIAEYRCHREYKSLAPDGQPCSRRTVGLLQRRPVEVVRALYVGKESNRLEDVQQGLIEDEDEVMNEYSDPRNDPFVRFVVPVLQNMPVCAAAEESGLSTRTVKRTRSGESRPQPRARLALTAVAAREARSRLADARIDPPRGDFAALHLFLRYLGGTPRMCAQCGRELQSARARFCSATCRKRFSRNAAATPLD